MSAGLKERDGLENEIINLLKRGLDEWDFSYYTLNDILQHVWNHDEIKNSPSERAKKDKIRRIISKSPKIEQTPGRTKRKRYHISVPTAGWENNRANREVMLNNELLGGYSRLEDVVKHIWDRSGWQDKITDNGYIQMHEYGFYWDGDEELTPTQSFLQIVCEQLIYLELAGLGEVEDPYPPDWISFELLNDINIENISTDSSIFVKTKPSCWFENGHWLPNSYFGFQGPSMLNEIITNISSRLEQITDEEIKDSNVKSEIEWLNRMKKSKKRRHSNKYIFTLAILHLNRSLLGSNMAEL